jgi:hypothetical protein
MHHKGVLGSLATPIFIIEAIFLPGIGEVHSRFETALCTARDRHNLSKTTVTMLRDDFLPRCNTQCAYFEKMSFLE